MRIFIDNPTGRRTEARRVTIGPWRLFFSYQILIAASGPGFKKRLANHGGPTTGRHFCEMGLRYWPQTDIDADAFAAEVHDAMTATPAN